MQALKTRLPGRFDRCPKTFVQNNRQNLVIAGLTLIRAYLESDDCKTGGAVPNESTASFSDWDYLVRQTVAWIAKIMGESEYVDPAKAFKQVVSSDPELQTLGEMLSLLQVLTKGNGLRPKILSGIWLLRRPNICISQMTSVIHCRIWLATGRSKPALALEGFCPIGLIAI